MKRDMDTIQFESRRELEEIIIALDTFLEEHPNHDSSKTAELLRDKLDVMHMEW